jgi:hypothetical protein
MSVTIEAPQAARNCLYYMYVVWCGGQGPGGTEQPSLAWQPISSTTLNDPGCPLGTDESWSYSVGAPGYAIALGALYRSGR